MVEHVRSILDYKLNTDSPARPSEADSRPLLRLMALLCRHQDLINFFQPYLPNGSGPYAHDLELISQEAQLVSKETKIAPRKNPY